MADGDKQLVQLPDHVIELLSYANNLIQSGDDSAVIPSDDLIQTDAGYGGLDEEGEDGYSFVFFPGQGTRSVGKQRC